MIREEFTVISNYDQLGLAVITYQPEGEVRAVLQIAHGMCEHKERYEDFMRYLAEHGIACMINDHRGHGASVRSEEDLGWFGKNGAEALVSDLHQLTGVAKRRWPGKKIILMGHSMGSLAVRVYLGKYSEEIEGLIISGSPGENKAARIGMLLTRIETMLRGERFRSAMMYNLSLGAYEKRFAKTESKLAWLSKNKENVQRYSEDPYCMFCFTLNGYDALLHLVYGAYHLPKATKSELPIRFYSGEDDPCAPDAKGFRNAIKNICGAGYTNVKGHMFKNMRHEILQEEDHHSVFEKIRIEAIESVIGE